MKNQNTRRGFTLIELLVVVLIIGILAAVAVPQYQKAVAKAKITRIIPFMATIYRAQKIYKLNHGNYATDPALLDIDFPPATYISSDKHYFILDWECYIFVVNEKGYSLSCTSTKPAKIPSIEKNFTDTYWQCIALTKHLLPNQICRNLAKGTNPSQNSGKNTYYFN